MWLMPYGKLPQVFQNSICLNYYNKVKKKQCYLIFKRIFDIILALFLSVIISPIGLTICILIKIFDRGEIIYKQKRIKQNNKEFYIYKFKTMVENSEKMPLTLLNDNRITKTGHFLRKYRLDELPQLFNIIKGDMSFVGARPEMSEFVAYYTDSMYATLLLPVGLTSKASIDFKDEGEFLKDKNNPKEFYIKEILPIKMATNIEYLEKISLTYDINILIKTIINIFN